MSGWYARLQQAVSISTDTIQNIEFALDLGRFSYVTIQVRKLHTSGPTGTIYIDSAPVLDADAFEASSTTFNIASTGNLANVYSNLGRYLRWRAASVTGTPRFLIDVVARDGAQNGGSYSRLQEPVTVAATGTKQRLEAAIDLLDVRSARIQVRKLIAAGTSGTMYLQHAAALEEDAFMDVDTTFTTDGSATYNLGSAGNESHPYTNLLRYLRWRADFSGSSPTFLADVVGRGV